MKADSVARDALLAVVPSLRGFAFSLCHNKDEADDLVQETLLSAWTHLDRFAEGSNLRAWLFTILRNHFLTSRRKMRRIVEDANGEFAKRLSSPGGQDGWVASRDLRYALAKLPHEQREALVLVGASGLRLEEVAEICGCEIGTVKSRVSRGRAKLAEIMSGEVKKLRPAQHGQARPLAAA